MLKLILNAVSLALTNRPLLEAVLAYILAVRDARATHSDGGSYITIEERPAVNRKTWSAYDVYARKAGIVPNKTAADIAEPVKSAVYSDVNSVVHLTDQHEIEATFQDKADKAGW